MFFFLSTKFLPLIAALLPIYLIVQAIGMLDNIFTLVVLYTSMNLPIAVWMMRSFLAEVPKEILEAAEVDGAGLMTLLLRIVAPIAMPGMAATALICFIFSWNEFMFAVNLTATRASTRPSSSSASSRTRAVPRPALRRRDLVSLPVLIAGFAAQDKLVRGLSLGPSSDRSPGLHAGLRPQPGPRRRSRRATRPAARPGGARPGGVGGRLRIRQPHYDHGRIGRFVVEEPLVLGHEAAGTITQVGAGVPDDRVGQRVSIEPGVPDLTCEQCLAGRYNLCPRMRFFATPPIDGAFAEYVVVHEAFAHPVPDAERRRRRAARAAVGGRVGLPEGSG